jgi:hypothetical protein
MLPQTFLRGWALHDLQADAREEDEGSLFLSKPEPSPNTIRLA